MGAIVMDDCLVESNSIVAAGAVVTANTHIREGEVWAGVPAIRGGTLHRTPSRSRPSLQQRCLWVLFLAPVPGPASLVA